MSGQTPSDVTWMQMATAFSGGAQCHLASNIAKYPVKYGIVSLLTLNFFGKLQLKMIFLFWFKFFVFHSTTLSWRHGQPRPDSLLVSEIPTQFGGLRRK